MASRFDSAAEPAIEVKVAPLIELQSSLCGVLSPNAGRVIGFAARVHERDPGLGAEIVGFWEDGWKDWIEVFVIYEHLGLTLTSDVDAALDAIESAAARRFVVPALPSEEAEVQPLAQARIDRLAASTSLRAEWMALLRRLWAAVRTDWEAWGEAEAVGLARALDARVTAGESLASLVPSRHFAMGDGYRDVLARRTRLILTPQVLNPENKYILQADGGPIYLGFGAEAEGHIEDRRKVREVEAAAFKVFADRTRLGILTSLLGHTSSITDLARSFDVSQPTVSAHVKILRDAGLLTQERRGALTLYRADKDSVKALLNKASAGLQEHWRLD